MASQVCSRIIGTGSYFPPRVVTNKEVAACFGFSEEEIYQVTGIKTRHWVEPSQVCSELAEHAARQALAAAGQSIESVDAVLVSTTSPDTVFPSTACYLQQKLQAPHIAAFDLAASCTGFLYGLSVANAFIRSGQYQCCLVVAAEVKSRYLDASQRESAMLFGDGAGAIVLRKEVLSETQEKVGIVDVRLYSDGASHNFITVPAGGSRLPITEETVRTHRHAIALKGGPVFRAGVRRLSEALRNMMVDHNLDIPDIAQVIVHQANGRMLQAIAKRVNLMPHQLFSMIEEAGNTSSASLPIALDRACRQQKFKAGDLLLLGAFGGGLTWGTALIRW